jgi:hypothetical protein
MAMAYQSLSEISPLFSECDGTADTCHKNCVPSDLSYKLSAPHAFNLQR